MQKIKKEGGTTSNKRYLSEEDAMKIYKSTVDEFIEYQREKEKHDFKIKILGSIVLILLLVLLIIWFGGYYLFPPIKNYIDNSNINSSFNGG